MRKTKALDEINDAAILVREVAVLAEVIDEAIEQFPDRAAVLAPLLRERAQQARRAVEGLVK